MSIPIIQAHSLILPQYYVIGTETEPVNDLVTHISREVYIADIHEKKVQILAIENVAGVNVPGNLECWIELSPVRTITSGAYWAAIGGGGGPVPPTAPLVLVGTGVDGASQTALLPWNIHSEYARVVVQTPVAADLPNAFWQVQVILSGKTP